MRLETEGAILDSAILDVVIGLVFLFCLMSLAAASLREAIEALLKTRAILLEQGVRELLGDAAHYPRDEAGRTALAASFTARVFSHPRVNGLYSGAYPTRLAREWRFWHGRSRVRFLSDLPSYVPAAGFAAALIDVVARPEGGDARPMDMATLRRAVSAMAECPLRRALISVLDEAGEDIGRARGAIERWYDMTMDRVSGWYRRESMAVLFGIGLVLAACLNVDAVAVGQRLLVDRSWRDQVVAQAAGTPGAADSVQALERTLRANGFMIGAKVLPARPWHWLPAGLRGDGRPRRLFGVLAALPGYLIVALATSLGAPFWFDVLKRLMTVRSTFRRAGAEDAPPR